MSHKRRWPQALALSAVLGLSGMTAMYTPLLVHPVLAARTCTITLHPGNTGSLAGRKFELYRLMDAQEAEDGSSIHYTINPLCKPALVRTICDRKGIALQDMTDQQILDEVETYRTIVGQPEGVQSDFRQFVESLRPNLMQYANPEKRVTITQADVSAADGSYVFKNLKPGWYLLNEADIPSSAQTHQAASLCVVDTWTKNMDVQLKGSVPQLIKKIEEDDQNVGWNDIGDYQGGQNIPYRIDVAVPSMEEYDTYFMKIHDVMDAGLTLHPDSIRCSFVEGSQIKTIPAGQYRVETGTEGETFAVCFDDVKGLVNSILPKFDAAGNHVYGQTLRIEFEGEFNENAFTSGEGMTAQENDARLEYSSDPRADGQGKHNFTPWDTVVSYSYALKATKINDADKPLKDAAFRLYEDEACTREILLRPAKDGYFVMNENAIAQNPDLKKQAVEMVTGADGIFRIYGLDQGSVYLKETRAPQGYRGLSKPVQLDVLPTFTNQRDEYTAGDKDLDRKTLNTLEARAVITNHVLGQDERVEKVLETSIHPLALYMDVVNRTSLVLPLSGSSTALVSFGASGLLVIGGLSLGLASRRKSKAEDEMENAESGKQKNRKKGPKQ